MADGEQEQSHPDRGQYVSVGIILAAFTAIEVAIAFSTVPSNVAIPMLLVLTVLKFALVVMWFMHLRFDSGWFRRLFVFGLVVALVIYAATITLMLYTGGGTS